MAVRKELTLYNSLSRKKEGFHPIDPNSVKIYQCGPTVYWTQHIGNMRAMVMADLAVRTLKYLDYGVKFARNYTDVGHLTSDSDEGEDKMAKGAKREGLSPDEIARKYIKIFEKDVASLNTLPPNFKPRATEHIQDMIDMVKILLDRGFAYKTEYAIYFDVSMAKDYTKLSGQNLEENLEEAGRGSIYDKNKKHPADFSLWFFKAGAHENALQTWPNPFSHKEGFPGWHIECSAMIKKLLGDTIDIHIGGIEHIPVHHTNEIAQSESANDIPLARYWLHNEHLTVNNKKMAKSEGTTYSLAELIEKGHNPLALRYFFLNSHYRSKQNFTFEALEGAGNSRKKIVSELAQIIKTGAESYQINERYEKEFDDAILNDFNVPEALAVLWKLLKDDSVSVEEKLGTVKKFDEVLGLKLIEDADKLANTEIPAEISKLAIEREAARGDEDWTRADELRAEIEKRGYEIKDNPNGPQISSK